MKIDEKAAEKFTALMIEKIKTMTENWKKPWISERIVTNNFKPRNINGGRMPGKRFHVVAIVRAKRL